ncbi:hypothetical protein KA005_47895, partial [bacterium]|nr:hypothetical protein [bacterium]
TDKVTITDLPEYFNTDSFTIAYSAVSDNAISAQFYSRKDSDPAWHAFGGVQSGASGQVDVGGSQINDGDGLFKVEINGGTAGAETDVRIDRSGPSPVSEYKKESSGPGHYKLLWKNPPDSDFYQVLIYRSDDPEFTANGSTKVGEVGGSPSVAMHWEESGLDTKTYYYALRAVDKAGNGSGVVHDQVTEVTEEVITTAGITEGEVVVLPQEGDVLGEGDADVDGDGVVDGEEVMDGQDVSQEEAEAFDISQLAKYWWVAVVLLAGYYFYKKRQK